MNNLLKMNLEIFGEIDKDFFTKAFEESYNIGEDENIASEDAGDSEKGSNSEDEQIVDEKEETPENPSEVVEEEKPKELSPQEIKELYEKHFGQSQETHQESNQEMDAETQSALELYKFLEENPHLVQAMREVDETGYQQLNNYVPDEMTRKMQEFEEYIEEQKFNAYLNEMKTKFSDFDEDKVLEYAEEHEIYDLEVAYKALKFENVKSPNVEELREQIKNELLEELKQNSLSTQTIVGTQSEKPIEQNKVTLSPKEHRIASAMGMSDEEYAKWI